MTWLQSFLAFVTGLGGLEVVKTFWTGFAAHRAKRAELQNSIEVKQTIEGTDYLKVLMSRIDKLEADRDRDRARLDESDKRVDKLERVLERIARGYEDLRRNVLKVVRRLRDGKTVEPELLDELEQTPDVEKLLQGVLSVSE